MSIIKFKVKKLTPEVTKLSPKQLELLEGYLKSNPSALIGCMFFNFAGSWRILTLNLLGSIYKRSVIDQLDTLYHDHTYTLQDVLINLHYGNWKIQELSPEIKTFIESLDE